MKYEVAICICTYRRRQDLLRLLNSLLKVLKNTKVNIVVVDNDREKSAEKVCWEFKSKINLIYKVEEKKGLAYARNKCIAVARELQVDYIVFLDDDEIVEKDNWLESLLNTAERFDSEIVTGPVIPLYETGIQEYIKKSGFFFPTRHKNGTILSHTGTGNTLIKMSILDSLEEVFSLQFNESGGEDTYLFMMLVNKGYTITWSDEAEIFEYIPKKRANIVYIIKRAFYSAITFATIEKLFTPSSQVKISKLIRILKGFIKILKGIGTCLTFPFVGRHILVKGLVMVGNGYGDLMGSIGRKKSTFYR